MTCCTPDGEVQITGPTGIETDDEALLTLSRKLGDGTCQLAVSYTHLTLPTSDLV